MKENKKQSIFQEVTSRVGRIINDFWEWLKPNPADHWLLQTLKTIGKIPLVLLLILCSPILLVLLLVVFLIAL